MTIGSKAIWGCDIVEVCSIIVNNFVVIKVDYSKKIVNVHIDSIEFI